MIDTQNTPNTQLSDTPARTPMLGFLAMISTLGMIGMAMTGCSSVPTTPPKSTATPPKTAIQTIKDAPAAKNSQTGNGFLHMTSQPTPNAEHDKHDDDHHDHIIPRQVGTLADFEHWLQAHPTQKAQVQAYQSYLTRQLGGVAYLPPMHELLTTARSWQECGYEPYQVPPSHLWEQMLPTIRLYNELKSSHILPPNTQIRSVYRNAELNRCAGGAAGSKHMTNGAMDIWVPTYDVGSASLQRLQDQLCTFWQEHGHRTQFGLGLYATGAIHLDTQGFRKWGAQFSHESSPCRLPKPNQF